MSTPEKPEKSGSEPDGPPSFFRWKGLEERLQPGAGLVAGKIVGDFRLVALIGQGGMGQVWEAEQLSLHRTVAVKFVRPERVTERQLEFFAREARAGGRLSHPGIVSVHGHGQSDGLAWIAMEFVGGAWTLKDFLDEAGRAEEVPQGYDQHVARFVAEIAEAMQAAHEAGVIHRDLKPQNVLITSEDRPKVTDFGLARLTDEAALSVTGDFAGTYLYMSPEQALASRMGLDHRTDIFSLGVVLYETLALRRPFEGDTTQQVTEQIVTRDPPDPRTIRSKIPRDLAVIANHALEKERDKRYPTMQAFAADLRRYLAHEPIQATPPTRLDRAVKWTRRNPGKSSAAVIVAVTFTVIALLLVANVRTNRALERSNAALATKTTEAQASAREALDQALIARTNEQVATDRAEEVLRLSAFQRLVDLEAEADRLWPAEPERLDEYERWLERAHELVAGLEPHGDDPGHRARLAKLRERAVTPSAEAREDLRRAHPRFRMLAPLEARVVALRAAQDVRDGKQRPAAFALDVSGLPSDALGLDGLARPLVDPARTEFGREAEGLALARLAIEKVEDDEGAVRVGETLAWALFASGLDDEALQESTAALAAAPPERRRDCEDRLAELRKAVAAARSGSTLAAAEAELSALQAELSAAEELHFADEKDTWWHSQLRKLVAEIEAFADPKSGLIAGISPEHGWGIEQRRAFAATVEERSIRGEEARRVWSAALASIANPEECPRYGGLRLTPQLGLLPIGRDPDSGLWEFAHLASGEPAERGADGQLLRKEAMGLVFVLIPGGTFPMGAQNRDPKGPNHDPQAKSGESPVHAVTLSPYFLSKYEMTQGQWERCAGRNPSQYGPDRTIAGQRHDRLHPVEQVTWFECLELLTRLGLTLPSEAQWERACRAGTDTPWSTGAERESLRGRVNLADQSARKGGATWADIQDWPDLEDGWLAHAAAGSFPANPFGLHEMHGNVWEWCLDGHDRTFYARSPAVDPVAPWADAQSREVRGGSFHESASYARSAHRDFNTPDYQDFELGLRPAMTIGP